MCGRYTQTRTVRTLAERFRVPVPDVSLLPRYNIAPGQEAPLILSVRPGSPAARPDRGRTLRLARWGLIPHWSRSPVSPVRTINARAESVEERRSYRDAFRQRRCLVCADGFYEWDARKTPWHFRLGEGLPFAFAGLWDRWPSPDGREQLTFSVLTTAANPMVRTVHARMPVILKPEDEDRWLDPENPPARLRPLLAPYPHQEMRSRRVTRRVNSVAHDDPDCLREAPQQGELGLGGPV